jgi:tripartite-type tricarboxylate transporter receptor subunit TctC
MWIARTAFACWYLLVLALQPHGQSYPERPVRLVEPFGAGGGVDVIAREVSKTLSEMWGQPVLVENHPGAGSTAAPALVAQATPDGYTLLVNSNAQIYSAAVRKDLPYDPIASFIPVAPLTTQAYVLVTGASSTLTSIADLVRAAKAQPGRLKFGSPGLGTGSHAGSAMFNRAAGITTTHVPAGPNQGIAETLATLAGGQTDYVVAPVPLALVNIESGKLRALAVTTKKRSPLMPQTPTVAESGIAGFDYSIWYGVWAPAGTPATVVGTLSSDIARALTTPDLRDWLARHGAEPMNMSQPQFARFINDERKRAARVLRSGEKA